MRYWTKKHLYEAVQVLRSKLEIDEYPFLSILWAEHVCHNATVEIVNFKTDTICGILYKDEAVTRIALNERRTPEQRNFDCAHEMIHYFFHPEADATIICDAKAPSLDTNAEWQANEGASELLMPYQIFGSVDNIIITV